MKNLWVIVLAGLSVTYAGYVDAAPKKRTRMANRIGAYGGAQVGYTTFSAENSAADEAELEDILGNAGVGNQNLSSSTEDTDLGYQAMFGYRFIRYFAVELGLAQFGELKSTAKGDVDFDDGDGFVPTSVSLTYKAGGPIFSAIGVLPINDKFELFARLGYMFGSAERTFSARIDGNNAGSGSSKGDSQVPVYGLGFAWNINQIYQQLNDVGQENRTGQEDLEVIGLGLIIRF